MRDWKSLIDRRLSKLKLPENQRDEVVAELAAHLEDLSEDEKGQADREQEGPATAAYETTDWSRLASKLQRLKRNQFSLNGRSKAFWVPAFVTFAAMQMCWTILARTTLYERISSIGVHPALVSLIALPFFGALGAYLSRRGGGRNLARITAGVFPAIAMFCLMAVIFPISLVVDHSHVAAHWMRISLMLLASVGASGLALLVGTLPFLSKSEDHDLLHQ